MAQQIQIGSKVVDRDGFDGVVVGVTDFDGSRWYDVRFRGGVAVRYPEDLTLIGGSL